MVKTWAITELGMYEDVAGLFAEISTVDDIASFGSPLTPVLVSLVHKDMFSEITNLCANFGLRTTLWVDDLTISGDKIPKGLIKDIRKIISKNGFKSHKIKLLFGKNVVFITGVGVDGLRIVPKNSLHKKIRLAKKTWLESLTIQESRSSSSSLLNLLGTVRYVFGAKSPEGQRAANFMNSVRQKQAKRERTEAHSFALLLKANSELSNDELVPWF